MKYGYSRKLNVSFDDATERVKAKLSDEGFGILTEIDVKATLKKKLDVDFDRYIILGACNPPFAHKSLQIEREVGLLLPCNVIVYEDRGGVFVSAIVPSVAMGMVENAALVEIAVEVEDKLRRVIDSV